MKFTINAIFILLIFFVSCLSAAAQFKQLAEGPKFAEPEEGFAKIIQMKSGNTFYVNITTNRGINVRIYDPAHKETVATAISPSYDKLKTGDVEGVFEINNDVVLLISEKNDHTPVLYRLIIDGNTGKLKKEETIAQLHKEGAFVNTTAYKLFNASKDPYSDNYAVALYNVMESDREKRIEIIHYGKDHAEISRAFCASPDADNKFLLYVDMVVMGSDKVCAFLFASEEKYELGNKKGNLILATIKIGSPVEYSTLNLGEEVRVSAGLSRYNPVTKNIQLLAIAKLKASPKYGSNSSFNGVAPVTIVKDAYAPYLVIIDPATKNIKNVADIGGDEKLNAAYKERYDKSDDYAGLPQNLFINDDGSFTIVFEQMLVQKQSQSYSTGFGAVQLRIDTKLGKMVVESFDQNAKLLSNYLVPKSQWVIFQQLSPFYHARRNGGAQALYRGNQYKSFTYLNGTNKNYILFNDTEKNNDVVKDKFKDVEGISDCDAFMYHLTGSDVFPKREYAFGAPAGGEHNLALYAISDYDKKNNVYVTLKLDKEKRTDKQVSLVWLQPQ